MVVLVVPAPVHEGDEEEEDGVAEELLPEQLPEAAGPPAHHLTLQNTLLSKIPAPEPTSAHAPAHHLTFQNSCTCTCTFTPSYSSKLLHLHLHPAHAPCTCTSPCSRPSLAGFGRRSSPSCGTCPPSSPRPSAATPPSWPSPSARARAHRASHPPTGGRGATAGGALIPLTHSPTHPLTPSLPHSPSFPHSLTAPHSPHPPAVCEALLYFPHPHITSPLF